MKKFLPYILIIVIVLVGLFVSTGKASAQTPYLGTCTLSGSVTPRITSDACDELAVSSGQSFIKWEATDVTGGGGGGNSGGKTIAKYKNDKEIPGCTNLTNLSMETCGQKISFLFFQIVSFFLILVAFLFNFIIYLSLGGGIYNFPFVAETWAVARDLANLFFILVLLYISIRLILGLGGSEVKKMIARVIIMAMLVNFSMFFTKVVIDSSNILALIFYNKVGTLIKNPKGGEIPYNKISGENDVAGGLIGKFNPAQITDRSFSEKATAVLKNASVGAIVGLPVISVAMIALMSVGGIMMLFVIYIFLTIIIAFFSRTIELIVLIIFSPIAFVSFSVPFLEKYQYIGWHDWSSRLIKTAFMAPIFMFFLYIIFTVINADITTKLFGEASTTDNSPAGLMKMIVGVLFSLGLIMTLLWMAIQFAKKSSGKVGEMAQKVMVGTVKVVGTAVAAVATEGASLAATSAIGGAAAKTLGNKELQARAASGDLGAKAKLWGANKLATSSFDFGQSKLGKVFSQKTGINVSSPLLGLKGLNTFNTQGGHKGMAEREAKDLREESERYKTTETNDEVKARTTKEQAEYDKNTKRNEALEAAKTANGGKALNDEQLQAFSEDHERKNGPRPEVFSTAQSYNDNILKNFKASLGQRLNWGVGMEAGKTKFSRELEKGFKKMEAIQERITQTEDMLEKLMEKIGSAKKFKIEGVEEDLMRIKKDKNGNNVEEIDQDKVDHALGRMDFLTKNIDSQLKVLNETIEKQGGVANKSQIDQKDAMKKQLGEIFATTNKLSAFRTAEEKKAGLENQLYTLKGTRENINGGQTPTPTPTPKP